MALIRSKKHSNKPFRNRSKFSDFERFLFVQRRYAPALCVKASIKSCHQRSRHMASGYADEASLSALIILKELYVN